MFGWVPFLYDTNNDYIEMNLFIIDYANKNNITLNINDKNKDEWYLLLHEINYDNDKMVRLIIDYCKRNNIILNIKNKNVDDYDSFLGCY